jgi:uncharacterized protein (TIGR03086 family)
MDTKDLFHEATKEANSCIVRVDQSKLKNPTPCSAWTLKELLKHMVYEMAWVPDMLDGKTIAEVGDTYEGDLLGDDPVGAWSRRLEAAQAAVDTANLKRTVHLSYGDFSAEHYILESASDMLIHGWDVSQALFSDLVFNKAAAQAVYDFVLPRAAEFRGSGLFGDVVPTKNDDSLQIKLLAFYGRQENW